MPDGGPLPHLLTIEQLADHLRVTQRHIRRLVAERRIPFLKIGRFVRFDPTDVARWLDRTRRQTPAPKGSLGTGEGVTADSYGRGLRPWVQTERGQP